MVTKGESDEMNWEIGIDIYTLLYIKQITNKNLLYSTGNSTCIWEKNLKKSEHVYMDN